MSSAIADTALAKDGVEIRQATALLDGKDVDETRLIVAGPSTSHDTEVTSNTLDVWMAVSLDKSTQHNGYNRLTLTAKNESMPGELHYGARRYKFTLPYADPSSGTWPLRTNTKIRHRHTTEQMRRGNC